MAKTIKPLPTYSFGSHYNAEAAFIKAGTEHNPKHKVFFGIMNMQKFFILIIGMVLGIIIITILIPLTYDYSNRMALSQLLNEIKPLQQQIEKGLHDNNLQTQLIKSKQEYQDLLKTIILITWIFLRMDKYLLKHHHAVKHSL
ncbi:MAG: hypothetical protein HZT40_14760 [Candidatus Thiothrix singaporensis]|uniref:Uncharacterized protein n=1 Tax=Candidatus Thiothrix singaporensis TaxID=2799669 RepID=A0A7L6AUK7_9GAMM|nr:MAG: hypothetical protein HZT40_14760 [Candidatus Thiothrix singaporensis]